MKKVYVQPAMTGYTVQPVNMFCGSVGYNPNQKTSGASITSNDAKSSPATGTTGNPSYIIW